MARKTDFDLDIPDYAKEHLREREGIRRVVYRDSQGHLTVGTGHKLTKEEREVYKEGDVFKPSQIERYFRNDATRAWDAASEQAQHLKAPELKEALFHVNFQLGSSWYKEHKKTWALLEQGDFTAAAEEAADSRWREQTPKRVLDFQRALRKTPDRTLGEMDLTLDESVQKTQEELQKNRPEVEAVRKQLFERPGPTE
jgi:GH24 family phage-related lysozyme (muramidase)